jgi:ribosomal protein S24E|tara:strand:+ start:1167 stop:2258 length:1092 start_codon:yes stop_codon:yes gene_type:complete
MEALKALFESNAISEAMKTELEEAWNSKIKENRIAVTTELREEFAKKYEHDKTVMVEAINTLVGDKLSEEMAEFHEDRKQLAEAKAKYTVAIRDNSNLMARFVKESLVKEVSELHEDQKSIAGKFAVLEDFIVEQLANELVEFQEDKNDLAETKVRLVRESKSHLAKVRTNFIQRSAAAVSETVEKGLRSEISQLKEDINTARKNDFGRKVFEAFASEYMHSHLNEKSEATKLLKVLEAKDKQIAEAKSFAIKAKTLAEAKTNQVKRLVESQERTKVLNELTGPLSKGQKEIMTDLLESVQTAKLRSAFGKYLPTVIDGKSPAKQKAILSEAKEVTGNRQNSTIDASEVSNNVVDIKRLAGLN